MPTVHSSRSTAVARFIGTCVVASVLCPVSAVAQNVTLTIHLAGPQSGAVGVSPTGNVCNSGSGTQCSISIASGTAVALSANVPGGSTPGLFSAGTGSAAACATSTCSFTITAASDVTATFNLANGPFLTVSTTLAGDGQGEVAVNNGGLCQNFDPQFSSCTTVYGPGSVVSLTARAAAGSRFSGFSAGTNGAAVCGASSACSFTLNTNAAVTATFHALTSIAVSPSTVAKPVGESQSFVANGTYSNGTTEQVTSGGNGTWRTKAAIPATKFAFGLAIANGRLYAIGGEDGVGPCPCSLVRVYDPVANTWSTASSMPTPREGLAAVTVNGLIYAIGGATQGSVPTAAVERYDPSTNTWISRAPLPVARRLIAAGVVNGIIYAVGGETVSGGVSTVVATVDAYDPATNVWTPKAPMLAARSFHGVGVVNGILYAVGGDSFGTVEAYDRSTNSWTAKASVPTGGNGGLSVVAADDVLYAIGGSAAGSAVVQYDAVGNAWAPKTRMRTARSELSAAAINGTIYAIGGIAVPNPGPGTNFPLDTVEAFTDHLRWSSSAPAVARPTQQGQVNAVALGTADIVASVGSLSCGTACGHLTVTTPPTMAIDKASLAFAATSNGSAFVQQTGSQAVRLTQTGAGTVTWTATPTQPWITVSPTSGTGTATLTIGVTRVSSLPASGAVNAQVTLAFTGAATSSTAIAVALNIVPSSASGSPAGAFETPTDNATGVSGSIAVTGWAIDDVEVTQVRILRDPVTGETPGQLVFIATAVFVDGARPDVAQQFPSAPRNTRAGWGYLLLTNFLPTQGNGTFRLHAYADDADGHSTLLGSRTITCDNAGATRPFGAIDTPQQGDTVSGSINNFGWVLSRGTTTRADPPSGGTVVVLVDGVAVGAPGAWGSRSDLTTLFPVAQYAGVINALGVLGLDTTGLANGVHTIAWIVTDNVGGADGVGSRYFTTSNGSALMAEPSVGSIDSATLAISAALDRDAMAVRRGYDLDAPLTSLTADESGQFTMVGEELDRFELHLGDALESGPVAYAGYLRTGAELSPLPIGAHLDQSTGVFTWQPGVAFVGPYDFVFLRSAAMVSVRRDVRIVLQPKGSGRGRPQVAIDMPGPGEVAQPFVIAGWAADLDARAGTGVSTLHVWAYPVTRANPIFLGATVYGGRRPDVAEIYGPQYRDSGYGLTVQGLDPGTYDVAVFAWSTVTQGFVPARVVRITVR